MSTSRPFLANCENTESNDALALTSRREQIRPDGMSLFSFLQDRWHKICLIYKIDII